MTKTGKGHGVDDDSGLPLSVDLYTGVLPGDP